MSKQKPSFIIRLSKNSLVAKQQFNAEYLEFEIECVQNNEKGYVHTITPESIIDICEKPNGFIDIYLNCNISFFNVGFIKNDTLNIETLKKLLFNTKLKNMLNEKIFKNNVEAILLTSSINKEKLECIKNLCNEIDLKLCSGIDIKSFNLNSLQNDNNHLIKK